MNQPTKDALREQLALAADEIIRLRGCLSSARRMVAQDMARKIEAAMFYAPDQIDGQPTWCYRVRAWWRRVVG